MARQMPILPDEIVNNIISYGDPIVTQLYKNVMRQLHFNYKEFNYLRKQTTNFYRGFRKCDFRYFVLNRANNKKEINYNDEEKERRTKLVTFLHILENEYMLQNCTNHGILYPLPQEEGNFSFPLDNITTYIVLVYFNYV